MLVFLAVLASWAEAGHEIPYYPSFYPQEITLTVAEPGAARRLFARNAIHAYVGPIAAPKGAAELAWIESFRAFVVLTFNPASRASPIRANAARRRRVWRRRWPRRGTSTSSTPIPSRPGTTTTCTTPTSSRPRRVAPRRREPFRGFACPEASRRLPPARHGGPPTAKWDATLEEVPLDQLLREEATRLDGWIGPPWLKQGWFHAHALSARAVGDPSTRSAVEETFARRVRGDYTSATERLNLERRLVSLVTRGCERIPLAYALRREAVNDSYSEGVENVGFDSQAGLGSSVFFRTVKLKDFPWNGWLRVATATRPAAAWNPVAGFTDEAGALCCGRFWATRPSCPSPTASAGCRIGCAPSRSPARSRCRATR